MKKTFTLVLLIFLAGCFTTRLRQGAKNVRLMRADPPKSCEERGYVSSKKPPDAAKNDVRNQATYIGANYIRFEIFEAEGLYGTAFKCEKKKINKKKKAQEEKMMEPTPGTFKNPSTEK